MFGTCSADSCLGTTKYEKKQHTSKGLPPQYALPVTAASTVGFPPNDVRDSVDDIAAKKKRRLEKNRQSARDCRRRKKEHAAELEAEIACLETSNLALRLRLRVGTEAETLIREAKIQQIDEMEKNMEHEKELSRIIQDYKEKYADYGRDRRSALNWHLSQLKILLQPSSTMKSMLWILDKLEPENFYNGVLRRTPSQNEQQISSLDSSNQTSATHLKPSMIMDLCDYVGVSEIQFHQLVSKRPLVRAMIQEMRADNASVDSLIAMVGQQKHTLDSEMEAIKNLCTPSQVAKFIIWLDKNPACQHLLDILWDVTRGQVKP